MRNINLKRFISVVCAVVLLAVAVFEPSWFGKNSESIGEVQAADTSVPSGLTEIGWSDFGIKSQVYSSQYAVGGLNAVGNYAAGLNGTLLNGDIIMGKKMDIRFGANNGWEGLCIQLNDADNMTLNVSALGTISEGNAYFTEYTPAYFGLDTFVDKQFNLKISTEITDTTYTFGIWINDVMMGGYVKVDTGKKGGNYIGFYDYSGVGSSVILSEVTPEDYVELGWKDFGFQYQIYQNANPSSGAKGTFDGSLNKTLFHGKVLMDVGTDIRYAGNDGWQGFIIYLNTDGNIEIDASTYDKTGATMPNAVKAADYGLTTFAGAELDLKISTQISNEGNTYTFGVWINGRMASGYFALNKGTCGVGSTIGLYDRGNGKNVETRKVSTAIPIDYREISWDSLGLEYREYTSPGTDMLLATGSCATSIDEMNRTLLNGDITLGAATDIRYIGSGGWQGITITANADNSLTVFRGTFTTRNYRKDYQPADFGLTSFVGNRFNLKISLEISEQNYRFGIWVNNQMLDEFFTLPLGTHLVGTDIGFYDSNQGGTVTFEKFKAPTDFTELNWENFESLTHGTYEAPNPDGPSIQAKGTYAGSLHQTLLSDWVTMGHETDIRYAGPNGWSGFRLYFWENGNEHKLSLDSNGYGTLISGGQYLTHYTVAETVQLKISTEVYGNVYRFGIWADGEILGGYITIRANGDAKGNTVGLYAYGSVKNNVILGEISSEPPTDFKELKWTDFASLEYKEYPAKTGDLAGSGTYSGSLHQTLLDGDIIFGGNTDIRYGGTGWSGIVLEVAHDGSELYLRKGTYTGDYTDTTYYPADYGLTSFKDTKFNLKISTEINGDDYTFGVWVDNQILGNYFTVTKGEETAEGTCLGLYDRDSGNSITLVGEQVTLSPVYWNKADGAYTVPSTTTDINGNSITELTTVGDNYITYSLNGKIYERYVYIWEIGNVKVDDKVDARDLVRTKKLSSNLGGDTTEAGKEAADFDKDNDVDATDVYKMQRLLLGDTFDYGMTLSEKMLGVGKADVMPILGYYAPATSWAKTAADGNSYVSKDTVNETMYQLIADLGINMITASNDTYTDSNKEVIEKQLQLAQAKGLSLFVRDGRISGSTAISQEELQCYLDGYESFSSFAGLHLIDEPSTEDYHASGATTYTMDDYGTLSKKLSGTPGTVGYVNLLPYYSNLANNGTTSYQNYLNTYVEKYNPQYLSFDYYLFGKTEGWWIFEEDLTVADAGEYMQNLAMIRSAAKNSKIPFWSFVQAGENWNDNAELMASTADDKNTPTEGEFKWQANIALAFGAQGISYFPLIQPHYFALTEGGKMEYFRNGLIAEDGSTNQWYGYAKAVNTQIAAIDEVLMNATHKGIIAVNGYASNVIDSSLNNLGDTSLVISSYGKLSSVSTTGTTYGAVVGCFDYNGKTALYVVNYDVTTSRNITLNFSENVTADVTISGTATEKSGTSMTLSIGAGEGALVVLK